jgi:16S rRNA (cytidine1402-2'-O)-methyltransferase
VTQEQAAKAGRLSIVATPIGNLEDITLRALRTLREADLVLAEDTRRTRVLCERHGIARSLRAFHAHSSERDLARVIDELVQGKHVALVTDAGTPLISDPGSELVQEARKHGVRVEAVPGACAAIAALTVCGIPCDSFRFVGFLPRSGKRRRQALDELARDHSTTVLYESPQRLSATLDELRKLLQPERSLSVCRELTKLHEEVVSGTASEVAERFAAGARGEITIVVSGQSPAIAAATPDEEADLDAKIRELLSGGASVRDTVRALAPLTSLGKQALYARVQAQKTASRDEPA